jgi:hypothetical protein
MQAQGLPMPQQGGPAPEAMEMWNELQGSVGGQLWDRVHQMSPMSSTMYSDPQTAFLEQLSQMLQGQGKRDPDIEEFFQMMAEQQGMVIIPGYGLGDEADMEALQAYQGGV